MSGCCGQRLNSINNPQKFIFTAPGGKRVEYRTEIEAKAAQIRAGGGNIEAVA